MSKKNLIIAFSILAIISLGSYLYYNNVYLINQKIEQSKVESEKNVKPVLPAITKTDDYASFVLLNGMRVFVIKNKAIDAVSHMVWYQVGAKDEPLGKSGIAHLLEHLMFKGTPKFPKGKLTEVVDENGGNQNAFTGQDFTAYYQNVPLSSLEKVMEIEADRMQNLTFNDAEFDTERKVVMEEFRMRMQNNPRALMLQELDASLYRNHPYRKQVIGWKDEILSLKAADALEFHNKFYDPKNAVLIVAGNAEAEQIQQLAEKYYGVIKASYVELRQPIYEPERVANAEIIFEDERVEQSEIWQKFIAPSYVEKKNIKEAFALEVLARILGGGTSSMLYKSAVIDKKIASAIGASYSGFAAGPAEFTIFAYPAESASAEQLQEVINAELDKIAAGEIELERIEAAKKAMIAEQIYDQEGLQQKAYQIGQILMIGLPPEFLHEWEGGIKAVSTDEISAVAKKYLDSKKSVTGILQPVKKVVIEEKEEEK